MNLLLAPECILLICALLLLALEAFWPRLHAHYFAEFGMIGTAIAFICTLYHNSVLQAGFPNIIEYFPIEAFGNHYKIDSLALFFKQFFIVTLFFVLWMGREYKEQIPTGRNEFFILPLLTSVGLCLLTSASDFILLFIALELVTISFYLLIAYQRHSVISLEAGMKYLIMGGLSTAFLVYGIALVYTWAGSADFGTIAGAVGKYWDTPHKAEIVLSFLFIFVAVAFKVAAAPFHAWAPDIYQGAPTPVTAFLSIGSKAAGVFLLIHTFRQYDLAFGGQEMFGMIDTCFAWLAAASMILGTLAALPQRNLKRLLGYSSIANTGFILTALAGWSLLSVQAALIYLVLYAFSALLIFFILSILRTPLGGDEMHHYAGLAQRSPLLAFALSIGFISLAGLPPLAGFWGKWYALNSAWQMQNYRLLFIALSCAAVGIYYYLGIIRTMYWLEPPISTDKEDEIRSETASQAVPAKGIYISNTCKACVLLLVVLLLLLGTWQYPLAWLIQNALSNVIIEPGC